MNILYIGEVLFFFGNMAIADYHASLFDHQKKINHTFWALVVGVVIGVFTWASRWDWWFAGALLAERMWCFNPMLNLIRHKPFFYVHSDKVGGSWLDSKIGNAYPYVFATSLAGFIIAQFLI